MDGETLQSLVFYFLAKRKLRWSLTHLVPRWPGLHSDLSWKVREVQRWPSRPGLSHMLANGNTGFCHTSSMWCIQRCPVPSLCSSWTSASFPLNPLSLSLCAAQNIIAGVHSSSDYFSIKGGKGGHRLGARLSCIFRGQVPDILLILLSLGGMRHALIEWDTTLIFARDCTISSQDGSSGWPTGF